MFLSACIACVSECTYLSGSLCFCLHVYVNKDWSFCFCLHVHVSMWKDDFDMRSQTTAVKIVSVCVCVYPFVWVCDVKASMIPCVCVCKTIIAFDKLMFA